MKIEDIWKEMTERERITWLSSNGFWIGLAKHTTLSRVPHSVKKTLELNASKLEKLIQRK